MNTQEVLDPKCWAERTFGGVQLHDRRRTRRAVQAATHLAENPLGSLPAQMQTWKETKALYRLLDEPDGTKARLDATTLSTDQRTGSCFSRDLVGARYHRHRSVASSTSISGVGQKGLERGRGFFVQTVLAVHPEIGEVLGCRGQEPFVRIPAPEGEQRYQRRKRTERETDIWMRQVHALGTPDPRCSWVHVGDPRADMFECFQACRSTQTHFLVRAGKSRRVEVCDEEVSYALARARAFKSQASRPFEVPARHGRRRRSTHLQLAFGQMTLLPPRNAPRASKEPLTVWVIRVS
jgi:Transposase DNA-binding